MQRCQEPASGKYTTVVAALLWHSLGNSRLPEKLIAGCVGCMQADAWSMGVTLFQACFGHLPFHPPSKALDLINWGDVSTAL